MYANLIFYIDKNAVTVPYDKNFNRTSFHFSNLAFGASMRLSNTLVIKKIISILVQQVNGVNAYFLEKNIINL